MSSSSFREKFVSPLPSRAVQFESGCSALPSTPEAKQGLWPPGHPWMPEPAHLPKVCPRYGDQDVQVRQVRATGGAIAAAPKRSPLRRAMPQQLPVQRARPCMA